MGRQVTYPKYVHDQRNNNCNYTTPRRRKYFSECISSRKLSRDLYSDKSDDEIDEIEDEIDDEIESNISGESDNVLVETQSLQGEEVKVHHMRSYSHGNRNQMNQNSD